ncbi:hypothetical protein FDECE_12344 [Fusarium decemcellulare]|nr:hypothetical protein FDECE_12344 [Fusarium decemcellulare]
MSYIIPEAAQPFTLRIPGKDCSQLRELLELSRLGPSTWENEHQDGRYGIPHKWLASAKDYWLNHSLPYHVIVPSLPGYTLSSGPSKTEAWNSDDAARVINSAITALGFSQYVVQGGDVGCLIASILATTYDSVAAVHLNLVPSLDQMSADDPSLTTVEKAAIERAEQRLLTPTTGAAMMQSTRPATLGALVSSSPLALLAWIGEKMIEWPDEEISIDDILTTVSLYWYTETMPRCIYTYRGTFVNGHQYQFPPFQKPFGYSWFMRELVPVPRKVAEKKGNLVFYRQLERGGHFAALERPVEYLQDIEDFIKVAWRHDV